MSRCVFISQSIDPVLHPTIRFNMEHVLEQVLTPSTPTPLSLPALVSSPDPSNSSRGKGVYCIFLGPRSHNRDIQSDRRTAQSMSLASVVRGHWLSVEPRMHHVTVLCYGHDVFRTELRV